MLMLNPDVKRFLRPALQQAHRQGHVVTGFRGNGDSRGPLVAECERYGARLIIMRQPGSEGIGGPVVSEACPQGTTDF